MTTPLRRSCLTCTCRRPDAAACGEVLLLSTRVAHTLEAVGVVLEETSASWQERGHGVVAVRTPDPSGFLATMRGRLSRLESDELRVAHLDGGESLEEILAVAFAAASLTQAAGRVAHADLLPLFADEAGSFHSVYQPIVDLRAGERPIVAYEALLRAEGEAGVILPDQLFSSAQEAGWLHVLDRVGRTTALHGATGWLGEQRLFVNFLPTTIYRPEVCLRTTEQAAARAGLRLDQLVFEVTESEKITDLDHLEHVFAYYRERGCKVALDDLGAGYSSLDVLVRLRPDVVKLDKTIVQALPDSVSSAVVSAVVDITHAYGGLVLAECVETPEQALAARELGVDLGQGWYFGRPERKTNPRVNRLAPVAAQRTPGAHTAAAVTVSGTDPRVALAAAVRNADIMPPRTADVEALLTRAVMASSAGFTIADAASLDMPLIFVNEGFERMTGYRSSEVIGRNCRVLQDQQTDPETVRAVREAVREGRDCVAVLRNVRKDASPWWNELHLSAVRDSTGRVTHYFGFQHDVTERVNAERRATHLASHDQLTGLPNRRALLQALHGALETGPLALLFIDLDGFKTVNDRLGHATGDLALTAAAACLRGALREGDVLGRWSGDEFIALLPGVPLETADRVARRTADTVVRSLVTPLQLDGTAVQLGASIGVALFPEHANSVDGLLAAADQAMYAAKRAGGNQIVVAA